MQITAHAPIYGLLKFPSRVLLRNEIILTIVAFSFINTQSVLDSHFYVYLRKILSLPLLTSVAISPNF